MIQINSLASYFSMESPDNICFPSLIFHERDKETRGKITTFFFFPNLCTTAMQRNTGKEKKRKEKKIWDWVTMVFCVSELKKKIQNFYFFSFPALFLATKHNYRKHQQEVKNPTNEKPGAMKYLKRPMFGGLETKNLHGKGKRK